MKSISEILKDARNRKKISLYSLSQVTKIKKEFIKSIEEGEWGKLPEFPVLIGFVKNLAKALDMNVDGASAMLKRDYPPRSLIVNPKPDVARGFVWSPKLTFLAGITLVVVVLCGYLVYQYIRFVSPPLLTVEVPFDGQKVNEDKVDVRGKTDLESTIKVNNQPVLVDGNGSFAASIEVVESTKEIVVIAKSRSGKETRITRKIEVELDE